jgi:hypothetical protein
MSDYKQGLTVRDEGGFVETGRYIGDDWSSFVLRFFDGYLVVGIHPIAGKETSAMMPVFDMFDGREVSVRAPRPSIVDRGFKEASDE